MDLKLSCKYLFSPSKSFKKFKTLPGVVVVVVVVVFAVFVVFEALLKAVRAIFVSPDCTARKERLSLSTDG